MKYPNQYGSVIKLTGKRRKKYAVRISVGRKERIVLPNIASVVLLSDGIGAKYRAKSNDYAVYANDRLVKYLDEHDIPYRYEFVRQYKWLEFFEKSADAHAYLAKYNAKEQIPEHTSLASEPSFKDVYDRYVEFAKSLKKKPTETTLRSWKTGFNLWSDIHDLRFRSITTKQLQACMTKHSDLAKSSVGKMATVIKKMYKYAVGNQLCDMDLSPFLFAEYSNEQKYVHSVFTDEEIDMLWKHSSEEGARVILILIYTGMRCSEFLELSTDCIYLDKRYMTGGNKTDAGKNRVIPIHKRILPIIRELYDDSNKYLYPNSIGGHYTYQHFRDNKWKKWKTQYGLDHYTHDARHTCASKLEAAGVSLFHRKLILGHSVRDLTEGTYTHVPVESLIEDMNKWV